MRYGLMVLASFALMLGCDDGDGGSGDGGASAGENAVAANCTARCTTKASSCPELAPNADAICGAVCGESPTEGELSCLEDKSCAAIAGGMTDDCAPEEERATELSCDCNNDGTTDISGIVQCGGMNAQTCAQACACLAGVGG